MKSALLQAGLLMLVSSVMIGHADQARPLAPKTVALLKSGAQPVKIICFGDSITGVYYHTGSRRAWCDMLGIALCRLYPGAKLEMVNAGISGHTTAAGLERIERDVLRHEPQLVVVMFGMNDVARLHAEAFRANLGQIVRQCRGVGTEVILCTPNSIYPVDARRPVAQLAAYAEIVRRAGAELNVPVADCYRAYEEIRAKDPRAWMLLMSEAIHPNMKGHKLFAEEVAGVISGRRVTLDDVPPLLPAIPETLARLAKGEPVRVIAMPPYDGLIEPALRERKRDVRVEITPWPIVGGSLAGIDKWSQKIRQLKPDLVIVAVPADASTPDEAEFIRTYSWILNRSLNFGTPTWDCIAVLPSVAKPNLTATERAAENLALEIVRSKDIGVVMRKKGDHSPAATILSRWLQGQVKR